MSYLLDTNIVTAILKRNEKVNRKVLQVRRQKQALFISCISYYEIKRGLIAVNAARQLVRLNDLCQLTNILLLDNLGILETASTLHADLKQRGKPIQDADILIAATAMTQGLTLVSDDTDMLRIPGLMVENWLRQ